MASHPLLPPKMRAWVRTQRGSARNTLKLATDVPTPKVPTGLSSDVLIRVSHVALQYTSELLMKTAPNFLFSGPWIPEIELSGEVVAAGNGVPAGVREAGTKVVAFRSVPSLPMILGHGVLAEYVRMPASQVARVDATAVDIASASGVSCSGSTALKMIRRAGVREGHSVLVNGASGSVGSVLVQLCKLRGAKVVGVASGGNEEMVRGLGVDEFVDYKKHNLSEYLAQHYGDKPFDFVLDCVGVQDLFENSPAYLKPEGAVVNVGALQGFLSLARNALFNTLLPTWLGGVPRRYITFSTPPAHDDNVYLIQLMEEGRLRVPVDSIFDMEDAVSAYERIATKRARGKVLVKVGMD